jgi:hypothetical protein
MVSHAAVPVALPLGDRLYRIYFSTRDKNNCSHIGYIELDITKPFKILRISEKPILSPGPLGYFDDHGVFAGCFVRVDDVLYLYYLGWNPGVRSPLFYSAIGIAISRDNGLTFDKISKIPLLSRSEHDPCMVLLPIVFRDENRWRMWYGSGFKWEENNGKMQSFYNIKYAESVDGFVWNRDGHVCIDLKSGESNIAHPFVLKDNKFYKMWYSYDAGNGYRIGYAESENGSHWIRKDEQAGIEPSQSGWDSEAISHPHIIVHENRMYMLYNGNSFGRDGFGIAVALTNEE